MNGFHQILIQLQIRALSDKDHQDGRQNGRIGIHCQGHSNFKSISSKFHLSMASIKLSCKFKYGFCPMNYNHDGRQNGRHLLVCFYRHSTLVIYYPIYYQIAPRFHIWITFIKL